MGRAERDEARRPASPQGAWRKAQVTLLDTHVVYWLAVRPERLSRAATRAIGSAERAAGVAISSISLWELALLIDKGRIQVEGTPERFLTRLADRPGLSVLEITPQIAALTAQFPPEFPSDPADRIIAATARAHGLPLVTKDGDLQDSRLLWTIW
jgi:PIN domain nuclease of toxin-antitoxin system